VFYVGNLGHQSCPFPDEFALFYARPRLRATPFYDKQSGFWAITLNHASM